MEVLFGYCLKLHLLFGGFPLSYCFVEDDGFCLLVGGVRE
jgi:hypothetical protein